MDSLIEDIIKTNPKSNCVSLPPLFGDRLRKKKKRKGVNRKNILNKHRLKILYDVELRSKASSVLNPRPPKYAESTYKTSRLSQLSTNLIKNLKTRSMNSSINLSSMQSMHSPQRISYDNSRMLRESSLHLPMIARPSQIDLEVTSGGLYLSGNRKIIIERNEYHRANEELKKKVHKEIALGTDMITENSDRMSSDSATVTEFLRAHDRSNMRKSSFAFNQD